MEVLSTWKCYGSWVVNVKGQGQVTKLRYIPRLSCILFHLYVLFYLLFMYIRPISWLYFAAFYQHLIKHVMMRWWWGLEAEIINVIITGYINILTCGLLCGLHEIILFLSFFISNSPLCVDLLLTSLYRLRSSLFLRQKLRLQKTPRSLCTGLCYWTVTASLSALG